MFCFSDANTLGAKKTEDGKHYVVNGVKKWITNGTYADYFTVAVRTGGEGMGIESSNCYICKEKH